MWFLPIWKLHRVLSYLKLAYHFLPVIVAFFFFFLVLFIFPCLDFKLFESRDFIFDSLPYILSVFAELENSNRQSNAFFDSHFQGYNLNKIIKYCKYCFCSVAQSYPALCNPMNCSMPGFPVLHYLPEFAQTHVHWVCDVIQPSHP